MTSGQATEQTVARNFFALVSGEAVARLTAFATTIYIARTLGAESYGVIGFALAVILYLSRIADGGMEFFGLGIREIAEDRERVVSHAPDLITARLAVSALMAVVLLAVGLALPQQPDGLILALYGLTLIAIGGGTRWVHIGLQSARSVAFARVAGELTVLILVLWLVRNAADIARVPLAQLTGDALAATLMVWSLKRRGFAFPLRLRPALVLPIFKRSAPLVMSALLGLVVYNSDLIFLRIFRDATTVGYYAAAYTLVSFLTNLGLVYTQSLTPALTRVARVSEIRDRLYQGSAAQVFAITLPIALGGAWLAGDIIGTIFGAEFQEPSARALQLLLWSIPLAMAREVNYVALVVAGHQTKILRLTTFSAVMNIGLNILLIPRYGITGAATATVSTELFRMLLAQGYAHQAGFKSIGWQRVWRPIAGCAAMAAVLSAMPNYPLWATIPAGALAYGVVLGVVGGLKVGQRGLPALTV